MLILQLKIRVQFLLGEGLGLKRTFLYLKCKDSWEKEMVESWGKRHVKVRVGGSPQGTEKEGLGQDKLQNEKAVKS